MKKSILIRAVNRRIAGCLAVFLMVGSLTGCYYYKVETKTKVSPEELRWMVYKNKYLVLHTGDTAWHLIRPEAAESQVSGQLEALPEWRLQYRNNHPNRGNRYKHKYREVTLDQVHLYMQDSLLSGLTAGDGISCDYAAISKVELYKKAKGKTIASWVVPFAVPVALVGSLAIAVAVSSCPFVYIEKNGEYEFSGEIFGGAVYSSLERHDYMPLPGYDPGEHPKIKIANELAEVQHINLAELWIVNHPEGVSVLPDRHGRILSVTNPQPPVCAVSLAGKDLLGVVGERDQQRFAFDEEPGETGDTNAFNQVCLTFTVPGNAVAGKLIVRAGNTLWGDYAYGEFTKLFGSKYGAWIKMQGREPAEKNIRWMKDQRFVLTAWLETAGGWKFIDYFEMTGPMGAREMIMETGLDGALGVTNPDGERQIRIRLESGYNFWDLDYAAMDFTTGPEFKADTLKAETVKTESGAEISRLLAGDDRHYYIQEKPGEEAVLDFHAVKEHPGSTRTLILHTKGYYEHVRDYKGPPDKTTLQTFTVPGRFSRFSFDRFEELRNLYGRVNLTPRMP